MTTGNNSKSSSSKRQRPRSSAIAASLLPASIETLREHAATQAKYRHGKRTVKKYDGYVARCQRFAKTVAAQRRNNPTNVTGCDNLDLDLIEKAFDDPPNRLSVYTLELFILQKCCIDKRRSGTATSTHAALKDYWRHMDGDTYDGPYSYDKATDTVRGCPADSIIIKDLIDSLKLKETADGTSADRAHAVAMTIEDLEQIIDWSEKEFPSEAANDEPTTTEERKLRATHLMMRAFLSTAFTLWARCFELNRIQGRHLTLDRLSPAPYCLPFFEVFLENRKGYESKGGSADKEDLESNRYNIYKQNVSAMDMYTHVLRWLDVYTEALGRPLGPDEFLFPYISPNGTISPKREMSYDMTLNLLSSFVTGAGLPDVFTMHSTRRGGLKYRITYAPFGETWTLCQGRGWGGWALGESMNTLMKYLLDSINRQEMSTKDLLNPMRATHPHHNSSEDNPFEPVTAHEFRIAHAEVMARPCANCSTQTSNSTPSHMVASAPMIDPPVVSLWTMPSPSSTSTPPLSAELSNHTIHLPTQNHSATLPQSSGKENHLPPAIVAVPSLPRKKAWRTALEQWYKPYDETNTAIKDWKPSFYQGKGLKALANLRSSRFSIAKEWEALNQDESQFLARYPNADTQSATDLRDCIREHYGLRRKSKNGSPAERARRKATEAVP
ncbi:hypothetical protein FPV67DRAFT_1411251 [Lyophyllum atratum]|nr:hypothetical protein FPV67DRAFT_1411251 [Lyophyllum atratum]